VPALRTDGSSLTGAILWLQWNETSCASPFPLLRTFRTSGAPGTVGRWAVFSPTRCSCWNLNAVEQVTPTTLAVSAPVVLAAPVCSRVDPGCPGCHLPGQ
jgi:hypothetical protein